MKTKVCGIVIFFVFLVLVDCSLSRSVGVIDPSLRLKKVAATGCDQWGFDAITLSKPLPQEIQDLLSSFASDVSLAVSSTNTSSVTVNIVYDQDIIFSEGFGFKNVSSPSKGKPDGNSFYRIGSNTKIFTTLLTLILRDAGLLSLDDPVTKFAPLKPINLWGNADITFRQLGSHTSGLQREAPCQATSSNCNYTNAEMWKEISGLPLIYPHYSHPSYSNLGFAALGHLLEEVTGKNYNDLLQNLVLDPLGQSSTLMSLNILGNEAQERLAVGYTVNATGQLTENKISDYIEIGWDGPAGQLYSTANDLSQLIKLVFTPSSKGHLKRAPSQVIPFDTIREWLLPIFINEDNTGYGFPWEFIATPTIPTKSGSITGYLSYVIMMPRIKLGFVLLQSCDRCPAISLVGNAVLDFYTQFYQILQKLQPAPTFPPDVDILIGDYLLTDVQGNYVLNLSIDFQQIPNNAYPQLMIASSGVTIGALVWQDENYVFFPNNLGVDLPCSDTEDGMYQYVYFNTTSNPITISLPGLLPYTIGQKVN